MDTAAPVEKRTRVHNFIEFIASGRATQGLVEALSQAEEQVKTLSADVASMEAAKDHAFTPPPRAWIADRVAKLNDGLAQRTEKSAPALRRLTGAVTLTPEKPQVGRPYYRAACTFESLNLLIADGGSNLLHWWSRRELKPRRLPSARTLAAIRRARASRTRTTARYLVRPRTRVRNPRAKLPAKIRGRARG